MANRVSAATMRDLFAASKDDVSVSVKIGEIDGQEITMEVKKYLSLQDFGFFVEELAEAEFTNGAYFPQSAKILFDLVLVKYYTNVNLPEGDIELQYAMIQHFELVDKIKAVFDDYEQYESLCEAVEDAQAFTREQKTGLNGVLSALKNAIDDFDINKIFEQLKEFSPDQLQFLTELKHVAKAFNAPSKPVERVEADADV